MKAKALLFFILSISITSVAQKKEATRSSNNSGSANTNWGIGLRFGDPAGISFKKYLNNSRAVEINLGRSTYWGYDYRDGFYFNFYGQGGLGVRYNISR